jgi:hypothetical protein
VNERHLRSIGPEDAPEVPYTASPPPRRSRTVVLLAVLAGLLVLGLLAALWSRSELVARVEGLEAENSRLLGELVLRERLIEAHRGRLEDVRTRVDELRVLLDEPVNPDD